jgi:DNA-binding MarR family transcriptional regulator
MPDLASRLSEVDREICDLLECAEDENGNYAACLGADIAEYVGVKPQAIGSRLSSLRKHGLVRSMPVPDAPRLTMWCLTDAGIRGGIEWR